jgi:hypothetical protein
MVLLRKSTTLFLFYFAEKRAVIFGGGATSNERKERRIKKNYIIICGPWAKRNPASLKPAGIFCAVIFVFFNGGTQCRGVLGSQSHSTASPFPEAFFFPLPNALQCRRGLPLAYPGESILSYQYISSIYLFLSIIQNVRFTFSSSGIVSGYEFEFVRENLMWCGFIDIFHQKSCRLHRSYYNLP